MKQLINMNTSKLNCQISYTWVNLTLKIYNISVAIMAIKSVRSAQKQPENLYNGRTDKPQL